MTLPMLVGGISTLLYDALQSSRKANRAFFFRGPIRQHHGHLGSNLKVVLEAVDRMC